MVFSIALDILLSASQILVHSWTWHTRLACAQEPSQFDPVLSHMIREVKFQAETQLSILFFIQPDNPSISWILISLIYTLFIYTFLEAMTGETLYEYVKSIPAGRILLACLTRLPTVSVLSALCMLSGTTATATVFAFTCVSGIFLVMQPKVRAALAHAFGSVMTYFRRLRSLFGARCQNEGDGKTGQCEKSMSGTAATIGPPPRLPTGADRV